MIPGMDRSVAWRAALLLALCVAALAATLGAVLPRSFFADWGWAAGPGAWALSALVAATVLRLPPGAVLAGAALSGLPMLLGVAVGVHWLGAPLGLAIFGFWCGRLGARRGIPAVA